MRDRVRGRERQRGSGREGGRKGTPLGVDHDCGLGGERLGVYLGGLLLGEDLVIVFLGADRGGVLLGEDLVGRRSRRRISWHRSDQQCSK